MAAPVTESIPVFVNKSTSARFSGKDGVYFHVKDDFNTIFSLSATEQIEYSSPAIVTTNPVMSGVIKADNIQIEPRIIKISGVVVPDMFVRVFYEKPRVSVESFINSVSQIRKDKKTVTVVAPHKMTIEQAFITKFAASKDNQIANGIRVTIEFQEVDPRGIIGQTTVNVKPKEEGAEGKKDAGSTQTKTANSDIKLNATESCLQKLQMDEAPTTQNMSEFRKWNDCLIQYRHNRGLNGGKG